MQMNTGNPTASAVIWDWQDTGPSADARSSGASNRLKGVLQGCVTAGAAALMWLLDFRHLATVAGTMAAIIVFLALVSPKVGFTALQRLVQGLGALIGRVLGWVVLFALFYLFFVPFGALFRRARRDTMKRYYEADAPTYWDELPAGASERSSRTRQF